MLGRKLKRAREGTTGNIEFIKEVRRPSSVGGAQGQAFQEEGTEDAKALR